MRSKIGDVRYVGVTVATPVDRRPEVIQDVRLQAGITRRGMDTLPSGTVTFLFTDIEGSTRLFQQHPDAMPEALARHHALLQDAIDSHRGRVFNVVGDGFCSVFERADDAAAAALRAQRALHREPWGGIGALRVRMGLHTGSAEPQDGEYASSLTLARAQRVMNAGHGGQTLLSAAAAERVRPTMPPGTTLRDSGRAQAARTRRTGNAVPARRRRPAIGVPASARRGHG